MDKMTYQDKHGYRREPSDLVHRHRAYHHIYLKNRKKYPLPFEAYEIHHIDGDKNNNRMDNLAILTPEEHDKAQDILRFYGVSVEKFDNIIMVAMKDFGVDIEQLLKDFHELSKKLQRAELEKDFKDYPTLSKKMIEEMKYTPPKYILIKTWDTLFEDYKNKIKAKEEAERIAKEEEEEAKRKKIRNEKIKAGIKKGFNKLFGKKK